MKSLPHDFREVKCKILWYCSKTNCAYLDECSKDDSLQWFWAKKLALGAWSFRDQNGIESKRKTLNSKLRDHIL